MIDIMSNNYTRDLLSGFVLSLISIPMCMGIALSSGLPISSGLLSGIIGGIVVGMISKSNVSVTAPAAGFIGFSISAIFALGSLDLFFLAVFFAGVIQILMGTVRLGFLSDYIPSTVVSGLMAAIGFLVIIKQLPFVLYKFDSGMGLSKFSFAETGIYSYLLEGMSNRAFNVGGILIAILSIALILVAKKYSKFFKNVPGPIIAIVFAVGLNEIFRYYLPNMADQSTFSLNLFSLVSSNNALNILKNDQIELLLNKNVYLYATLMALIASLETSANLKAVESLDGYRQRSPKNRELIAQGCGNILCGLLGGAPLTSVIGRSTLNIEMGASSKKSTIINGIFLLSMVAFYSDFLNRIPVAGLSAIMIYIGTRLISPSKIIDTCSKSYERTSIFILTFLGIICLGMLYGLLLGSACSIVFILRANSRFRFDIIKETHATGEVSRIILPQQITFLNKASLIAELSEIPKGTQLVIDGRHVEYIDEEVLLQLKVFRDKEAVNREIDLNMIGFRKKYNIHDHINFINVPSRNAQQKITPLLALEILIAGNNRFVNENPIHRSIKQEIKYTSEQQNPIAIVLGCIDSRVPVETIFDMGFGELFCVRVAGNILNSDIMASIEYACKVAGAKLIIVLGHSECGAIKAACDSVELGSITNLLGKIKPAIAAEKEMVSERNSSNKEFVERVAWLNIKETSSQIKESKGILSSLICSGDIGVVGAKYDVSTGMVKIDESDLSSLR